MTSMYEGVMKGLDGNRTRRPAGGAAGGAGRGVAGTAENAGQPRIVAVRPPGGQGDPPARLASQDRRGRGGHRVGYPNAYRADSVA
jgi:hypothetical protein